MVTEFFCVDVSDASIFGTTETDSNFGLFEGLKTAKKLGETLDLKGITLSIQRKGKKAIYRVKLGDDLVPSDLGSSILLSCRSSNLFEIFGFTG
jgi:hypothetical protein